MLITLAHELKYYFKNKQEAIYLYSFIVSVLLLVPFALTSEKSKLQEFAPVSLWIALACAVGLGAQGLFRRDHESGRLEQYQLLSMALEGIVFAKWLAFYCFLLLPLGLALPIAVMLYALPPSALLHMGIGVATGAAALSILVTSISALLTGLEKAGAVISLIMLPISIPLMIFGAAYCRDVSALWQPELIFLLAFSAFMLPVMCFAGAYAIRNAN